MTASANGCREWISELAAYASTCSGALDANYAISYVNGTVQVGPANLVITASDGTQTYGGSAPVITAQALSR